MNFIENYIKKRYRLKYIDEHGDTYYEQDVVSMRTRNAYIKQWKNSEKVMQYEVGDITVFVKNSGEELWVHEI